MLSSKTVFLMPNVSCFSSIWDSILVFAALRAQDQCNVYKNEALLHVGFVSMTTDDQVRLQIFDWDIIWSLPCFQTLPEEAHFNRFDPHLASVNFGPWLHIYRFRRCWNQDGVLQLGEGLLDVQQHARLQQTCWPADTDNTTSITTPLTACLMMSQSVSRWAAVPGSLLVGHKSGRGSQGAAKVLADVDLLCGGGAVDWLLSGHLHGLPLALHSWGEEPESR